MILCFCNCSFAWGFLWWN